MKLCICLPMYRKHFSAVGIFLAHGRVGKRDESSSQFDVVQNMVIPFAILQSIESEDSDLFISQASSAREPWTKADHTKVTVLLRKANYKSKQGVKSLHVALHRKHCLLNSTVDKYNVGVDLMFCFHTNFKALRFFHLFQQWCKVLLLCCWVSCSSMSEIIQRDSCCTTSIKLLSVLITQ